MAEREEQHGETAEETEDLMKEAAPPSVLGDVEDAVTPDVDGELTPWSPRKKGKEEREA
ncbi:MAG: hypothetical protein KY456_10775 [Chloroflexi bacterium]|nr:hypothetical protein [Chloroflexota bacterium]